MPIRGETLIYIISILLSFSLKPLKVCLPPQKYISETSMENDGDKKYTYPIIIISNPLLFPADFLSYRDLLLFLPFFCDFHFGEGDHGGRFPPVEMD